MKMHTRVTAALGMTLGLALFATALPATAANEILGIGNGTLLAKGLAFELSYTYTCDPGFTADSSIIDVIQGSKDRQVVGRAGSNSPIECTGDAQTIRTSGFIKDGGPRSLPLKNGIAYATMTVNLSQPAGPGQVLTFAQNILLRSR